MITVISCFYYLFFSCSLVYLVVHLFIYWHCTYSNKGDNFCELKYSHEAKKKKSHIRELTCCHRCKFDGIIVSLSEKSIALEEGTSSGYRVALSNCNDTYLQYTSIFKWFRLNCQSLSSFLLTSYFTSFLSPINYDPSSSRESLLSQLCFRLKLRIEQLRVIDHLIVWINLLKVIRNIVYLFW